MNYWVDQPLLRTPVSLIIDDSCPVINKAWFWIEQRHQWRVRRGEQGAPLGWEKHYDKLHVMPRLIPSDFAREFGEWCADEGIKGKFSFIPFPAGVGRVDRGFPEEFPKKELDRWIDTLQTLISPNFDITPEMITHTRVMDLKTGGLTDQWEQEEWSDPPPDLLTDYIATALEMLKRVGIRCTGVTSPGAFGAKQEREYARSVLEASRSVTNVPTPFYFLHVWTARLPEVSLLWVDTERGEAVGSVIACTDDWFGATGWDLSDPDRFITEGMDGGRLVEVINAKRPAIMLGHFPCFYANDRIGLRTLQRVKKRLDAFDPDGTQIIWMKPSDIVRYEMAKELSQGTLEHVNGRQGARLIINSSFPTPSFTIGIDVRLKAVVLEDRAAKQVWSLRSFQDGTFLVSGDRSYIAFPLKQGATVLKVLMD